jgi:hypothetical protein
MDELFSSVKGLAEKKILHENSKFNNILQRCFQQVKFVMKNSQESWMIFKIPHFIAGHPLINVAECSKFLLRRLSEYGFDCEFSEPDNIIISWFDGLKNSPKINTPKKDPKDSQDFIFSFANK